MSFTPATKQPMMLALAWKVHQSEVVCVHPEKSWLEDKLLSFWGPVSFQGRTVKLPGWIRNCDSHWLNH